MVGLRARVVVIGASTGGPRAVTRMLKDLPAALLVPVAVVVHMPIGHTAGLARRMAQATGRRVAEGREGTSFGPGEVALARAGVHLRVLADEASGRMRATVDVFPADAVHRPSVDVLFQSAVAAFGSAVVAVVLTGMGDDGVVGARCVREAGGVVLCEAESTCAVYGMPRRVSGEGLADGEAPIDAMAALVATHLQGR